MFVYFKSQILPVIFVLLLLPGCGDSGTSSTPKSTAAPLAVHMGGSVQGNPISLTGIVSTLLGPNSLNAPGPGRNITTDGLNLYLTDGWNLSTGSANVRRIVISTGALSTVASGFTSPTGITTDGTYIYVLEGQNGNMTKPDIKKIELSTGITTTLVAPGILNNPVGITTDGTNLYIAESYFSSDFGSTGAIVKIASSTGSVTTLVAPGVFARPAGITTDGKNLYMIDNFAGTISKINIATGTVTMLVNLNTTVTNLVEITTDGTNLFVSDFYYGTISKIEIATGAPSTLISTGTFQLPAGVTTDGTNLFVVDVSSARGTIDKVK